LPPLLSSLLPSLQHLHLHLFPYTSTPAVLHSLLDAVPPDQLLSLSLPFSARYLSHSDLVDLLSRIGGKLQKLDLRGSSLAGSDWVDIFDRMGSAGNGLQELDLGFTSISFLPSLASLSDLRKLSLASCLNLPPHILGACLRNLPGTIEHLDLSRLDQIPFQSLWDLRVVSHPEGADADPLPTRLAEIKVVGIDHLTRRDVRNLNRHWEDQRRPSVARAITSASNSYPHPEPRTPEPRYHHLPAVSPSSPPTPDIVTPSDHPFLRALSAPSKVSEMHSFFPSPPSPPRRINQTPTAPSLDTEGISIHVVHSAILESEDEEGYRRFIGEVVGGTLGLEDEVYSGRVLKER
ncbi:hypothetical protein P7C73_g4556, partial [Tremellales sp. Uapishka_1]